GTLYVSTLYERFKSTDFGDTWTNIVEDPANFPPFVHTLVVAPSDPQTLYETGDGANVGATWRSRDGGATWQGPFPFRGDLLAVDPVDPDTVYGGGIRGLFVSHDGGETFTEATNGVPPLSIEVTGYYGIGAIAIDPARPRFALAGTSQGLFTTMNRGTTWTALPQRGLAGNPGLRTVLELGRRRDLDPARRPSPKLSPGAGGAGSHAGADRNRDLPQHRRGPLLAQCVVVSIHRPVLHQAPGAGSAQPAHVLRARRAQRRWRPHLAGLAQVRRGRLRSLPAARR